MAVMLALATVTADRAATVPASAGAHGVTIAIIPAKIEAYQVSAGGFREKNDEWFSQAKRNILSSTANELQKRGLGVKVFTEDRLPADAGTNLKEIRALFETVNDSIIMLRTDLDRVMPP